jgi:rod shape-determining protein MreD
VKSVRDGLVLLVALVLQSTVLHRIEIAGARPDLLIAFVVYIAWMRGPVVGTIAGFAVGLIQDLDASVPLGLNAFAKSLVGFLVAKAGFRVHRANAGVRFGFFFIAMLVHDVIYYGVASGGDPATFAKQMVLTAVPSALYTGVVVVILLGVVEIFSKRPILADEV